MKNPRFPVTLSGEVSLQVSVSIDEEVLLQDLVEKLAHCSRETDWSGLSLPAGWVPVETSSIEAFVSGTMQVQTSNGSREIPYTTCFAYTCTRAEGESNSLRWANSLS